MLFVKKKRSKNEKQRQFSLIWGRQFSTKSYIVERGVFWGGSFVAFWTYEKITPTIRVIAGPLVFCVGYHKNLFLEFQE